MALTRLGPNNSANISGINLTSQVTGTLPAANGGTGTTSYTPGITNAEQWNLTSSQTLGSGEVLLTPFSRLTSSGVGNIGTNVSSSSGVFTFSSTGIYAVRLQMYINRINHLVEFVGGIIKYSTNGSDYSTISNSYDSLPDVSNAHCSVTVEAIIDVTNTSNNKIKFMGEASDASGAQISGTGSVANTAATFIRLGDT